MDFLASEEVRLYRQWKAASQFEIIQDEDPSSVESRFACILLTNMLEKSGFWRNKCSEAC